MGRAAPSAVSWGAGLVGRGYNERESVTGGHTKKASQERSPLCTHRVGNRAVGVSTSLSHEEVGIPVTKETAV